MSYARVQRILAPTAVGTASASSTVEVMFGWRRNSSVLGYGTICTLAGAGTVTTQPVYGLYTAVAGASFVQQDTIAQVVQTNKLGSVVEHSALLKAEVLTSPDAYLAALDLNAGTAAVQGDLAQVETVTAGSFGTTVPKYLAYMLIAFKGS